MSFQVYRIIVLMHVSVFQMEQLSDEEIDHGAEEDSLEDQDLDRMFGAWLGS